MANSQGKAEIQRRILAVCKAHAGTWEEHIRYVVKHAVQRALQQKANVQVVELAAWLHDIEKIQGRSKEHHVTGAAAAARILRELQYPEAFIGQVRHCILTHSSDQAYPPKSKEAKILASADALWRFDHFPYVAHHVYGKKGYSVDDGRRRLLKMYADAWRKLLPTDRKAMKKKYESLGLLLGEEEK